MAYALLFLRKRVPQGFNRNFNQRMLYGKGAYFAVAAGYSANVCAPMLKLGYGDDACTARGECLVLCCGNLPDAA